MEVLRRMNEVEHCSLLMPLAHDRQNQRSKSTCEKAKVHGMSVFFSAYAF